MTEEWNQRDYQYANLTSSRQLSIVTALPTWIVMAFSISSILSSSFCSSHSLHSLHSLQWLVPAMASFDVEPNLDMKCHSPTQAFYRITIIYHAHVHFPLEMVPSWDLVVFLMAMFATLATCLQWYHRVKLMPIMIDVLELVLCDNFCWQHSFDVAIAIVLICPFYMKILILVTRERH